MPNIDPQSRAAKMKIQIRSSQTQATHLQKICEKNESWQQIAEGMLGSLRAAKDALAEAIHKDTFVAEYMMRATPQKDISGDKLVQMLETLNPLSKDLAFQVQSIMNMKIGRDKALKSYESSR